MKTCTLCETPQPLTSFHARKKSPDGRGPRCRSCINAASAEYRSKNRTRLAANQREYYQQNVEARKAYNRLRATGVTQEQYDTAMVDQIEMCAICCAPHGNCVGKSSILQADHDHATGAFRGLLCGMCNSGLAMFRDSPANMRYAIEYLENQS